MSKSYANMTPYLTGKTALDETVHIYFVDSPYLVGLILNTCALNVVFLVITYYSRINVIKAVSY